MFPEGVPKSAGNHLPGLSSHDAWTRARETQDQAMRILWNALLAVIMYLLIILELLIALAAVLWLIYGVLLAFTLVYYSFVL